METCYHYLVMIKLFIFLFIVISIIIDKILTHAIIKNKQSDKDKASHNKDISGKSKTLLPTIYLFICQQF